MVGDVVLAPLPFTNLSGIKIRPAVVLADVGMQGWVLCEITSNPQLRDGYIAIGRDDMDRGRLRLQSWARPRPADHPERLCIQEKIGPPFHRQARRNRSRRTQLVLTQPAGQPECTDVTTVEGLPPSFQRRPEPREGSPPERPRRTDRGSHPLIPVPWAPTSRGRIGASPLSTDRPTCDSPAPSQNPGASSANSSSPFAPLRALPAIPLRHHQPQRAPMVGRKRSAVVPIGEQHVVVLQDIEGDVGRVAAVAVHHGVLRLRLRAEPRRARR